MARLTTYSSVGRPIIFTKRAKEKIPKKKWEKMNKKAPMMMSERAID